MGGGTSRLLVLVVLIAALGGGAWWWLHSAQAAKQEQDAKGKPPPAAPVEVATAAKRDIPVYLTGLGSVQAYNTVTVHSRVDGELQEVHYTEGQTVKQGDLLAQIDPRPFKAALDQAVAKQAQDAAQLANAKLDLGRSTELATRGFSSSQQRDTAQSTVNQLTAAVQADQAAVDNARTQLDYTTITAPLTGRAGLRLVDRGNIVHAADTGGIVEIVQLHPIAAVFTVPESDLQAVLAATRAGAVKVWATTPDGKTDLAEGKLLLLDNSVDMQSGTVRLKAAFDNDDNTLWPGQSVSARVLVDTLRDVVAVPPDAVLQGPKGAYSYVLGDDGKVQNREIKTGETTGNQTVVTAGLEAGDRVVTAGHYRLRPGSAVRVVKSDDAQVAETELAR